MKPNHLVDNILQATEILAKRYPGGWKNIRSIHLKTETSMSIPIHISNLSANDVGFVDTTAPQKVRLVATEFLEYWNTQKNIDNIFHVYLMKGFQKYKRNWILTMAFRATCKIAQPIQPIWQHIFAIP